MKNVASRRTLAAIVGVAVLLTAMLAVIPAEAVQGQSAATEREIEARVQAELEARMAEAMARLHEREARLEMELAALQRRLESSVVNDAQLREMMEGRVAEALARTELQQEETRRRVEEAMRRAARVAEEAAQRAYRVGSVRAIGSCELFGERLLDRAEDLELTDGQVQQIRAAQRGARRARIERNAEIEVAEMDLELLYENEPPDLGAIRAKLEELAALQVEGQMAGLTLHQQVRSILTAEQLERWDSMTEEHGVGLAISEMSGNWRHFNRSGFGLLGC